MAVHTSLRGIRERTARGEFVTFVQVRLTVGDDDRRCDIDTVTVNDLTSTGSIMGAPGSCATMMNVSRLRWLRRIQTRRYSDRWSPGEEPSASENVSGLGGSVPVAVTVKFTACPSSTVMSSMGVICGNTQFGYEPQLLAGAVGLW